MNWLMAANALALVGEALFVVSSLQSRKTPTLIFQAFALLIVGIANLILGGFSGALLNLIAIIRNIAWEGFVIVPSSL